MSNWNNNQNIFHYLSAVIDHFLRVNEKLPFTEHLYQSIIVHMSALFCWNTTDYSPHDMHCINDTVILICADKLGGQLAPVLPLSWPCQPANLRPLQETATTLATISVLYPAQAALTPGHRFQICLHLRDCSIITTFLKLKALPSGIKCLL